MTTATETKAALTSALKDFNLKQADFTKAQKAYDSLKGSKRVKADFEAWLTIGNFSKRAKEHLASEKTNLNSGLFGQFVKTYFPLLNSQDISNAIWLVDNQPTVETFTKGKSLSNPASIKNAIRKELKADDKADDSAYEAYGLKAPKTKGADARKDSDGEVKVLSDMDKKEVKEILPLLVHAIEALEGKRPKLFSEAQTNEIDNLACRLGNLYINCQTKNGYPVKVNDIAATG